MSAPLFCLLYTSMIALEESPSCIVNILRVARKHNESADITGLLVFDGLHFCQYLEGSESAVLRLMERIREDKRHGCISVIQQEAFEGTRRFNNWSMGYALATDENELRVLLDASEIPAIVRLQQLLPKLSMEPDLL
ncbi:MAG: BLUF domain-containing protein [Steroidobacteraceae bacterium]